MHTHTQTHQPMRMPPGVSALLSPGTVFLFAAMFASSITRSTRAPSICNVFVRFE